jgi:arsenate reductase
LDFLITKCDHADQNCPSFKGGGVRLHWAFDKPAASKGTQEAKLQKSREVGDPIELHLQTWFESQGLPTSNCSPRKQCTSLQLDIESSS